MRIGIVTPFDSRNFGNRLQNYALQQILLDHAETVITIKNKPALPDFRDRLRRASPLAESPAVNALLGDRRKAAILRFNREYLTVTKRHYWYNRPCSRLRKGDICDWYCVGSDQIWNPELQREGGFNYLSFAPWERTFAYAASFGVKAVPEEKRQQMKRGLEHIRFLSLREEAGAVLVRDLTGRQDGVVLPDPTLLLRRSQWDRIRKKPRKPLPGKYLLAYFLGPLSGARKQEILRQAAVRQLEVIWLMDPGSPFYAVDPGEFLELVACAAGVCTDSFHGSVFSFLYGRPLRIFDREETHMESRLDTLAKRCRLESCRVRGDEPWELPETADYRAGYEALEKERLRAKAYLDGIFREDIP